MQHGKRQAILAAAVSGLFSTATYGAISIGITTPVQQNFDGIGTSATAALPTDWRADKLTTAQAVGTWSSALTATERVDGAAVSTTAGNGIYNFGSGTTDTGSDRAIGFLSSSTATKSGNLYGSFVADADLLSLTISYDVEKYRNGSNPAGFSIQMYYSTDGVSWTTAGSSFLTSFAADANNNGFTTGPGATSSVVSQTLNLSLTSGTAFYLAWNYSATSGSTTSNAQALSIDNVAILGVANNIVVQYFDTNGSGAGIGGSGTWDTVSPNWNSTDAGTGTPALYDSTKAIIFGGTGGTVSVSGTVNVQSDISFTADGYTLQNGTLQLAAEAGAIDVGSGLTAAINSSITGSGALSKTGVGILVLGGSNAYTGGTTISAGTLSATANGALPGTGTLAITAPGATLDIGSTSQSVDAVSLLAGSISGVGTLTATSFAVQQGTISPTLAGSGATFTKTGPGTVVLHGAATYTGLTSVQAGTLVLAANDRFTTSSAIEVSGGSANLSLGSTSQVAGNVTLVSGQISGGTLSASSLTASSGTINTVLAGSGGLTKTTDGFVTLSGVQTYTGDTVISGGTLSVTESLGATNITVGNLGALRTGAATTLGGTVTVNNTGIVNVGGSGSAGALTAGAMNFNAGSVLLFDLEQDSISLGGNSLTAGGIISYGGTASVGQTYTLFTGVSSLTGNFATGTGPAGVGAATYGFDAGTLTVSFAARVGHVSMTGEDYVQDFNTLAMSGSNSSLPDGFYFAESGTGANNNGLYVAGSGGSNAGDTYSFGQTNSTDRAIGGVASGTVQSSFGFALKNDTGGEIGTGQLKVSYVGERWRVGGAAADRLDFQYSLDATSLTTGTWVDVDSLDFTTVDLAALATGETDGNLAGNQKLIEDVLNISIADGSTLWIRWVDPDVTGGDDGLSVDSLVVSVPEPASLSLLALGGLGLMRRRRRSMATV